MSITVQHPSADYTGTATIGGRSLQFKDGKAEAPTGTNLAGFRHAGYVLSRGPRLAMMTVAELRQYAEQHEIDLGGATRKDEIVQAITEPTVEQ